MKTFTEGNRYVYPLTNESLVMEIGCYTGAFAKTMAEKYVCRVVTFEPIKRFFEQAALLFMLPPLSTLIQVENVGIGATTRKETFRIHGELSGIAADGEAEIVQIVSINEALAEHDWLRERSCIDLLSINAEGFEFEILEHILDQGLECRFAHIQVQPHDVVPNAAARWAGIRNRLLMNFRITSEDPDLNTGWLLMERK